MPRTKPIPIPKKTSEANVVPWCTAPPTFYYTSDKPHINWSNLPVSKEDKYTDVTE